MFADCFRCVSWMEESRFAARLLVSMHMQGVCLGRGVFDIVKVDFANAQNKTTVIADYCSLGDGYENVNMLN